MSFSAQKTLVHNSGGNLKNQNPARFAGEPANTHAAKKAEMPATHGLEPPIPVVATYPGQMA